VTLGMVFMVKIETEVQENKKKTRVICTSQREQYSASNSVEIA
jgi:hypothetical protein